MSGQATQLSLELEDDLSQITPEQVHTMYRAIHAIAASTLLEFGGPLAWGRWCRRKAIDAIRELRETRATPRRDVLAEIQDRVFGEEDRQPGVRA